jgi:hypothetical protein
MKTLYKTDSKDRLRIWKIWTEGAKIMLKAKILVKQMKQHLQSKLF